MPREVLLTINLDVCHACRKCLAAGSCQLRAIVQLDPGEPPYLEVSRCRDCRVCLPACPFGAVQRIEQN